MNAATETLPVFTKCPWPKSQVKVMVKDAIDSIGGQRAFDFVGPAVQRAIIVQACWRAVMSGSIGGPVAMTRESLMAVERTFCEVAGIWETEG